MGNENPAWLGFVPLLSLLFIAVIASIPVWRICTRTGLSKGLVAVLLVPFVGWLLITYIVAFSGWPIVDSLRPKRDSIAER